MHDKFPPLYYDVGPCGNAWQVLKHEDRIRALANELIGQMRKLYAAFDEPLTAEAEAAVQAMLDANPHGKHEYRLEDYDLSRGQVAEHFRDYIERYDVAVRA